MLRMRLLALHSVVARREWDGRRWRVYALDEGTWEGVAYQQWVDTTDWTHEEVRWWLGY